MRTYEQLLGKKKISLTYQDCFEFCIYIWLRGKHLSVPKESQFSDAMKQKC